MRVSLDSLVSTGQIKTHAPAPDDIQRLLRSIDRCIADSRVATISAEARFDCAHRAIVQCALVALAASGFRPSTNVPGHQRTMIQTLPLSMRTSGDVVLVLDALRRKRNLTDYLGESIDAESLNECIAQATSLARYTLAWLKQNHPELLT
jgi:hypothetical protein